MNEAKWLKLNIISQYEQFPIIIFKKIICEYNVIMSKKKSLFDQFSLLDVRIFAMQSNSKHLY
jgi:hypothetical protein